MCYSLNSTTSSPGFLSNQNHMKCKFTGKLRNPFGSSCKTFSQRTLPRSPEGTVAAPQRDRARASDRAVLVCLTALCLFALTLRYCFCGGVRGVASGHCRIHSRATGVQLWFCVVFGAVYLKITEISSFYARLCRSQPFKPHGWSAACASLCVRLPETFPREEGGRNTGTGRTLRGGSGEELSD